MSHPLISFIKACIAGPVLFVNTVVIFSSMIPLALLKLALPFTAVRRVTDYILNKQAELWVSINTGWMYLVQPHPWKVSGMGAFKPKGWYLVSSNHQSWVDILVLQRIFNRRIPLLKFFLKRELIYVPIMGMAWWALDFPFMRRQGGRSLEKDRETARQACEKFRVIPTSVISFLEGTRFTQAKHDKQGSSYRHLLKPKTGGIAMALETMGDKFDALLDVTIFYPGGVPTFTDLLCGKVREVVVTVSEIKIPTELTSPPDTSDPAYRAALQAWINGLWARKDQQLDELAAGSTTWRGPDTADRSDRHGGMNLPP